MDVYLGEGHRGQQMGDIDAARVLFQDPRISFPSGGGYLFPVQGVFLFGERSFFLPVQGVFLFGERSFFLPVQGVFLFGERSFFLPVEGVFLFGERSFFLPVEGGCSFPSKGGSLSSMVEVFFSPGAWGYSCLRPRRTISAAVAPVQLQNRDTSNGTLSTSLRCGRTASMPRGSLVTPPPPSVGDGAADTGGGGSEARSMQEFQSVSKPSSWPKALVCRSEDRERQTKRMPALKRS
eukprot:scaffold11324_cov82-Isochrysis_galbana.AAC.1